MTTSLPKIMFIRDRPIQINCMSVAYNFGSNLLRNMKGRLRIFLSFNWYFRLAFDGRRLTGGGTVFRPDDYPREGGRDLRSKDRPKDRRGGGKGRRAAQLRPAPSSSARSSRGPYFSERSTRKTISSRI